MKHAPVWKRLREDNEPWTREGEGFVLCHLIDLNKNEDFTAFVDKHRNFEAKVSGLFRGFCKNRYVRAKLVGSSELVEKIKRVLESFGVKVEKVVLRNGQFSMIFHSKERKIYASKADPRTLPAKENNPPEPVVPNKGVVEFLRRLRKEKIRVLIVDDSSTIRKLLSMILSDDEEIEVVGAIGNPLEVEAAIQRLQPDVITLDIHMPDLNGVELLKKYISKYPVPTVMISALSMEEGPLVLNALEAGAVDYIQKPSANDMKDAVPVMIGKIKAASGATVMPRFRHEESKKIIVGTNTNLDLKKVIAIGASTGGTEALKVILMRMPEIIPPIVVVQHIPPVFSLALAARLNEICPFEVIEGKDGDEVLANRVIIAPGGKQMYVRKIDGRLTIVVDDSEPVNRHKPSVDVLFSSVAKACQSNAVGVILTGMGADGAVGLLEMKQAGASTFAQNEETCVVYGMPQAAFKKGATDQLIPLPEIAETVIDAVKSKKNSKAS